MSHYDKRLAELATRFGIKAKRLLLAHESDPEPVTSESILDKRRAVENAQRAAGYMVCKGAAVTRDEKYFPLQLLVKI
jgi:hypothetical protein